ncbi:unnamed protein product [Natator depressus]
MDLLLIYLRENTGGDSHPRFPELQIKDIYTTSGGIRGLSEMQMSTYETFGACTSCCVLHLRQETSAVALLVLCQAFMGQQVMCSAALLSKRERNRRECL